MKKLIFACLFLVFCVQVNAQTPNAQILDTENDIIKNLAFAPAESNKSLNSGKMIELRECFFHGQGLPGSKPKTRVLKYALWYYTTLDGFGQPTGYRKVIYEIDMRQQLTVAYQNNSLVITCSTVNGRVTEGNNVRSLKVITIPDVTTSSTVNGRVTEGSNVRSLKVITIPDVTTNRRYANIASLLQVKFAALKVHLDRFYR